MLGENIADNAGLAVAYDAWYDAFGVRPGDRMYLPPEARVRIW